MKTVDNIKELESFFCQSLLETKRKGIENVIAELRRLGFFSAPASTKFHLNVEGGLLLHSINVLKSALLVRDRIVKDKPELEVKLPLDSVTIAALLHDTYKAHIYKKGTKRELVEGTWKDVECYEIDNTDLPVGHGEKSVIMLLRMGLELTDDEVMAIRWHMGAWDLNLLSYEQRCAYNSARDLSPLCALVGIGDGIASGLMER